MERSQASWFRRNFYIFDLFSNILKAKNISAIIYLILNVALIFSVPILLFGNTPESIKNLLPSCFAFVGAYVIIAFIALSPLGEVILRFSQGCKKIEDTRLLNRLEPLFMEVKETALRKHPDLLIHEDTTLFIKNGDYDANAFAVGRKSICVTEGLLAYSDDEIKAILGHEFGHIAMHDTDLILLITVGNFMITALVTIFRLIVIFFEIIFKVTFALVGGEEGILGAVLAGAISLLTIVFVDTIMFIWAKIGIFLVMKSSRSAEYEADAFSCDLGYQEGLLSFFHTLLEYEGHHSDKSMKEKAEIFAVLSSSHPKTKDRIDRILNFANQDVV